MTDFRLHVKAADFQIFGRLVTHITKFPFALDGDSISARESGPIQASFEVRKEPTQLALDVGPTPETTDLFFAKTYKNAIQRDALRSISSMVRAGKAEIFSSDGRVFEPASNDDPDKIVPDCSKPFRTQSLDLSDGRLYVTIEGEGPSTCIIFSLDCRIIASKIANKLIHLPRSLNKTQNGDHQQVFEVGAVKTLLELLLESVNEIIRDELDY